MFVIQTTIRYHRTQIHTFGELPLVPIARFTIAKKVASLTLTAPYAPYKA